mmetsp:Transcript_13481/g.31838  ORF Transcript_13481/g.31838 Transcript_13481/m.31838 type:complete len:542 (+) Transcript_13481:226-1851(+)
MSSLFNLMEAATALTQLGPAASTADTGEISSSGTTSPIIREDIKSTIPTGISFTTTTVMSSTGASSSSASTPNTISDDDEMSRMAALRENHLLALRESQQWQQPASSTSTPAPAVASTAATPTAPYADSLAIGDADSYVPASTMPALPTYPPEQVSVPSSASASSRAEKEMFPMRLHQLLADPSVRDIISWLPNGRSFVVLRPDAFASTVLPRYFAPEGSNSVNAKGHLSRNKAQGVHKYPSFTRKLNRWGFRQASRGPEAGAFCHDLFQRDVPELCRGMVCQKSRKSKCKLLNISLDDGISVSSASTMSTHKSGSTSRSGEKRAYSATVTVSTAPTTRKSLPVKKRRTSYRLHEDGVPSEISHRNQSSSRKHDHMQSHHSSHIPTPRPELEPVFKTGLTEFKETTPAEEPYTHRSSLITSSNVAQETLARHFREQHRAFALQSLKENSQRALEAMGIRNQVAGLRPSCYGIQGHPSPAFGAVTTHSSIVAATVPNPDEEEKAAAAAPSPRVSLADAARNELYRAYVSALSSRGEPSNSMI